MTPLWLALHFPRFALEVFEPSGDPDGSPAACVQQHVVVCANEAAEAAGIYAGMRLSSALGLVPDLSSHEREPARETDARFRLACWAGGFSPHVSLAGFDGPDTLLIEIGGCLRLFDGLENLCARIREGAIAQGYSPCLGLAPTPLAAEWLARGGEEGAAGHAGLRNHLGSLPVGVLGLKQRERDTLAALGIAHLGGLFALPSSGLARRFGTRLPLQLAQALGEVPDPRLPFVFPEHFEQKLELPAKVSVSAMLLFAARRLLASLSGWLATRASGISECTLVMLHEDLPPSHLLLSFAGATRELARMERVLRERLANWNLPEAVTDLRLEARDAVVIAGSTAGLFAQAGAHELEPVIERLRARLGKEAVHGLALNADHRPEMATRPLTQDQAPGKGRGQGKTDSLGPTRPLWLLPRPRRLRQHAGKLWHQGAELQRLTSAERIESGWWNHVAGDVDADDAINEEEKQGSIADEFADVRRDYYVAVNDAGEWLWVFNDGRQWWLHGVFA
ncbi:MAG: DNA polymerase Y family protein [Moraxellaceae bacterium]|nr:DNA polymerase Y family protein [Moraxellaceae bacterium]